MRKALLIGVAILAAPAVPALAADNGFYLGGSIGRANLKINDIAGISTADFKGDDTGFKLIAGIRPLDWLAVEANYVNFGKPEDTVEGVKLKADGDGISAFAVGFLPAGPIDLFGKVGLIAWDSKIASTDSGTDLAYGAGVQFRLLSLSLRAEYERFDAKDVNELSMFSVGFTYTFL